MGPFVLSTAKIHLNIYMTWKTFYNSVRGESWPAYVPESDFESLPDYVKEECKHFGYTPGEFKLQSSIEQKVFPIKSATACQLKWTWSTLFLSTGKTASCHRTTQHTFDTTTFNFHNTPMKINDRERMINGQWPNTGCNYCKNIEDAGGQSDRITNLDYPGIHAPVELDSNPIATEVTPRILEVYFDNLCNLKCLYCGPHFSSLWDAENTKHGPFLKNGLQLPGKFIKDAQFSENKVKFFSWFKEHGHNVTRFNILGGEPFYQSEFDDCLEFFSNNAYPDLDVEAFSNLHIPHKHLVKQINKIKKLVDSNLIKNFKITASIDCWGPQQEFVRYPLDLVNWEENFNYILNTTTIPLVIGSTITPLTVKTLPNLIEKINEWNKVRPVYHYFNSVNGPSYMMIDILGDVFTEDFNRALDLMPDGNADQLQIKDYMRGIAQQSAYGGKNDVECIKLLTFLDEIDRRRNANWRTLFPWLADMLSKYNT